MTSSRAAVRVLLGAAVLLGVVGAPIEVTLSAGEPPGPAALPSPLLLGSSSLLLLSSTLHLRRTGGARRA